MKIYSCSQGMTNYFLLIWIKFYYLLRSLWKSICIHISISSNKIVASNILGKSYGDNPGYIFDEILNQDLKYDLVWLQKDMKDAVPKGVRKVRYGSWRSIYELETAKIIINNVKNGPVWTKRKNQYYIQTWHGAFPLKYIEGEIEDKLSASYVELSKEDSKKTDLMLSGCRLMTDVMRNSFWYSGEILESGSPRNDMFFKDFSEKVIAMRRKLGIQNGAKIVLYAPTFRDNGDTDVYNLDINGLLRVLGKTDYNWVCIVRLHPNISQKADLFSYDNKIINGSFFSDPQELLLASDILITDYSSIMMDFAIMRKKVFLFSPDLEQYRHGGRGLRPLIDTLPFAISTSNEELFHNILTFDKETYLQRLDSFIKEIYGGFDDGHSSACIVERIKSVIKG